MKIIIRRMRMACWIIKAAKTHSGFVIRIAYPLRQWLKDRAPVLCYTYVHCLCFFFGSMVAVEKLSIAAEGATKIMKKINKPRSLR